MTYDEKTEALKKFIRSLVIPTNEYTDEKKNQDLKKLTEIYADDYKHSYSDLSIEIQNVFKENKQFENIAENLRNLKETAAEECRADRIEKKLYEKIWKLYDHINLEVGRYNFANFQIGMQRLNALLRFHKFGNKSSISSGMKVPQVRE